MKKNILKKTEFGFTLIEMMTTIAIMALILSLTIANIHGSDANRSMKIAQSNLISDLHTMQTYALNSKDYTAGVTPASAWGITFAPPYTSYTLQSSDNSFTPVTQNLSTVNLPAKVSFTTLEIDRPNGLGSICPTSATVQFSVPYGRILMSYAGRPCGLGNNVTVSQEPNDILIVTIYYNGGIPQRVTVNGISGNIVTQ